MCCHHPKNLNFVGARDTANPVTTELKYKHRRMLMDVDLIYMIKGWGVKSPEKHSAPLIFKGE